MKKYLYLIKKQKIKSWLKFWLLTNNKFNSILSSILEGTSFNLQNTVKRYFKIFNIFGNSLQDGTPTPSNPVPIESVADDVNLFDISNIVPTTVMTPNSNGGFKIQKVGNERISPEYPINIPANTNITISSVLKDYTTSNGAIYCQWIARDNTTIWIPNIYEGTTTTSFNKDIKGIIFYLQQTVNDGDYVEIEKLKIQKGTVATQYSPYNYGTFTIKQSGKNLAYTGWVEDFINRINDNTKAKLETYDNKRCLFYSASAGYGDYDNKYIFKINWKENTQYTIKCSILNTSELVSSNYNMLIYYTDGTYTPVFNSSQQNTWLNFSFTTALNKTIKYITSAYYSGQRYLDLDTFMVYEGTEESLYEPYQGYDFTFQTKTLRSLPNSVRDSLEDDGIHRRVGRVVLNGNETWWENTDYTTNEMLVASTTPTGMKLATSNILSSIAKYANPTVINSIRAMGNILGIGLDKTQFQTVNDFKTWLSTHNTEVIYELAEEVIEPYTEEQQAEYDKIKELYTFNGTTNIYSDDEVPPYLQIQYYMKGE